MELSQNTKDERKQMPPPPPNKSRADFLQQQKHKRNVSFFFPASLPSITKEIHKRDYSFMIELHKAYGLLNKMKTVPTSPAKYDQLLKFHSEDYIKFLLELRKGGEVDEETLEEYGILDDLHHYSSVYDHVSAIAGASLEAASYLVQEKSDVSLNYSGKILVIMVKRKSLIGAL